MIETIQLTGLGIGLATFLIIGIFHPIVIKAEYYFGVKCRWLFLIAGIVGVILSLLMHSFTFSALLGVFSFSCFWSIWEILEQRSRVEKGWFPANPKRINEYRFREGVTPLFKTPELKAQAIKSQRNRSRNQTPDS